MVAQSRQKAYMDKRRSSLEFLVGNKVFLKVSPMKGVVRTVKKNKLDPQYVRPFEILDRIRPIFYHLALPPEMGREFIMYSIFLS